MKFLVIRFSSIGDIVLTTPVVRLLRNKFPNSEIHFLTKSQFAFLVENNPNIDEVRLLAGSLKETNRQLKEEYYDYVIDLHNNIRTSRIKKALSIPDFTLNKLNIQKWLLVNLKINRLPNKHIVDRYIDTLSVFDIENDKQGLDFFIPDNDKYKVNIDTKPYVAFVIGATYYTKQIPAKLAIQIINSSNLPFVLLGGKEDVEKSLEIEKQSNVPLVNICGRINFNQSASVIEQAKLVITSDTGLMHVASAFNKPIVSVWGNTVPEFGMSPYLPHSDSRIFEIKDLNCRPCSKIGFNKCPRKHFNCMLNIDEKEVSKYLCSIYTKD